MRALLVLACLATGCISTHVAAGPTVTTNGDVGFEITAGFGMGLHRVKGDHALFLGVDGGGTVWPEGPDVGGVAMDCLDVVKVIDESNEPIFRGGARFGLRNGPDAHYAAFGGAVAILPYTRRESGGSGGGHEKGGLDLGITSWSQWGIGVEAQAVYMISDGEESIGLGRLAAIWEWTSFAY